MTIEFKAGFEEQSQDIDVLFKEQTSDININMGAIIKVDPGQGASSWNDLTNKPFDSIGENLKVVNGALAVDTTPNIEQDNTKPITSAAVYTEIGNIDVLLSLI